jgi:flagellar assembly protein FliH
MTEPRKFLFDQVFEVDRWHGKGVSLTEELLTRQQLAESRAEGYEAGRLAGRQEAEAEQARLIADSLGRIGREIVQLNERRAASFGTLHREALALGVSIARKLAARFLASRPLAEIESLVEDCLNRLMGEPRIVVRVHNSMLDVLQERIDATARRQGFAGQIILFGEDDLAPTDCRVEWADGGAIRTAAQLEGEIDELIIRLLAPAATTAGAADASAQ